MKPMTDEEFAARFRCADMQALITAQAKACLTAAKLLNPAADAADVTDMAVNMFAMALRELVLNVVETREDFLLTMETLARELVKPTDLLPPRTTPSTAPVRAVPL